MKIDNEKSRKTHCPGCGNNRNTDIKGSFEPARAEDQHGDIWVQEEYRILQCRGCDTVFFELATLCSEEIYILEGDADPEHIVRQATVIKQYPPSAELEMPNWLAQSSIPYKLNERLRDVYGCYLNDLVSPATASLRTALDVFFELSGIDDKLRFERKCEVAQEILELSGPDRKCLDTLIEAGSAAVHRGWKPSKKELGTLISALEGFFKNYYVHRPIIEEMSQKVPGKSEKINPSKVDGV